MPILFLLLSLTALADTTTIRNLSEETFTRNNSYCRVGNSRVEIQIRSHAATTERGEKKYGEYVFYYTKVKPKLLSINADKLNSYRLFPGEGTLCSKSLAYPVDNKVAVLFLKENRPYHDKLSFQLFDKKTGTPDEFVETEYLTDKAEVHPEGFVFRHYVDRSLIDTELGKVSIEQSSFIYQDRDFTYWIKYSGKGFEIAPAVSYQKFPWKNLFKDEKDFLSAAGWDETTKTFKNTVIYLAVNHSSKKECVLLLEKKIKPVGTEAWHCN